MSERGRTDTKRRTRHALRLSRRILLVSLLWGKRDTDARTDSVRRPVRADPRTRASTDADAHATADTKPRRHKRTQTRVIISWTHGHLVRHRNARGWVAEYVLEPKAESIDALVECVANLVPVVELKRVDLAQELVERLGAQQ